MSRNLTLKQWSNQRGFGAVLVVVVLVIMAGLAAALVTVSTTQQITSAEDVQSAMALAAARTGTDIGLFKALSSITPADTWKTGCPALPTTGLSQVVDLTASTGFRVTISCNSWSYSEGESAPGVPITVRIYQITAIACNSPTSCPDASMANSPGYIERQRQVSATN